MGNSVVQIASVNGITAKKYALESGTSNQFLKGDGIPDTNTYLTTATLPTSIFQGYPFNPFQNATTTIGVGPKSYFYTVRINRPTTINGFALYVGSGSDPMRVGIYRNFIDNSPTLVPL